ncbi:hypothetical protein RFI_29441 [Reticulomyxa filosa]|uniref:Uncharacterized protein n=1 Tax=Reticulomyxa filosa TaxID=46433 RepID=X6M2X0_RETFI|nr:hypothetical protein RFI_29441 [Reticulomyxa filosa]|eukprot:ETO07951.1 hypothetical protein RFI_29441 [Reticulomyxa filosa]
MHRKKHMHSTFFNLKDYYTSQALDDCYVRLVLLTQQQFQERKDKMSNKNDEKKKEKSEIYQEWPQKSIYEKQILSHEEQKTIELEDIWKMEKSKKKEDIEDKKLEEKEEKEEKSELELHHISIHEEAETEKSVLAQRMACL